MATVEQITANRLNAQSSTGPRTTQGKLASSRNSLKSGIWAESELIPGEDPAQLETLKSEYYERFHPVTPEARDLVDSLIRSSWLLRRLAAAEAIVFNISPGAFHAERIAAAYANNVRQLEAIQRRINAANRNYHRDLKALQAMPQTDDQPAETARPAQPAAKSDSLPSFASFLQAALNPPYMQTPLPDLGPIRESDLYGDDLPDDDSLILAEPPEDIAA